MCNPEKLHFFNEISFLHYFRFAFIFCNILAFNNRVSPVVHAKSSYTHTITINDRENFSIHFAIASSCFFLLLLIALDTNAQTATFATLVASTLLFCCFFCVCCGKQVKNHNICLNFLWFKINKDEKKITRNC